MPDQHLVLVGLQIVCGLEFWKVVGFMANVGQESESCCHAQLQRAAPEVGVARIGAEHLYR